MNSGTLTDDFTTSRALRRSVRVCFLRPFDFLHLASVRPSTKPEMSRFNTELISSAIPIRLLPGLSWPLSVVSPLERLDRRCIRFYTLRGLPLLPVLKIGFLFVLDGYFRVPCYGFHLFRFVSPARNGSSLPTVRGCCRLERLGDSVRRGRRSGFLPNSPGSRRARSSSPDLWIFLTSTHCRRLVRCLRIFVKWPK